MKKETMLYTFKIIRIVVLVYLIFQYYNTKEIEYLIFSIPFFIGIFITYIQKFNNIKKCK